MMNERNWVAGGAAAFLACATSMASADTGDDYTLSSSGWQIGETTTVSTVGPAHTHTWLMFDVEQGYYELPSGDAIELALGPMFLILDHGSLGADGRREWSATLADDPSLIGFTFYLQALAAGNGAGLETSNTLEEVVGGSGGGAVETVYPADGAGVEPGTTFEVWVLGSLDESTVDSSSVVLRDTSLGRDLDCDLSVEHADGRAAIVVTPQEDLRRRSQLKLTVADDVLDAEGNPLGGVKEFGWRVLDREHPFLFVSQDELALNKARAEAKLDPWWDAYEYHLGDVSNGLKYDAKPHDGPPPGSWSKFYDMYVQWFTDMKYAQALALEWRMYGDPKHGDKAVEIITDWLVFEPAVVGKWYWSIQYDIAGLGMLDAADKIWEYSGLSDTQKQDLRQFFDDLAAVVKAYQLNEDDVTPGNIRSWNNTLLSGIGYFNGDLDLVRFAIEGTDNPFNHLWMLDNAMEESGRMYDWVREEESPAKGITYPIYHLQAWSVHSEFALHNGRDLYHLQNFRGHDMMRGWNYYVPYMDGSIKVEGYQEDGRRADIARTYYAQKIFRTDELDSLYGLYGGEPYFEVHLLKKCSSLTHPIPGSLLGPDSDPPAAPTDAWNGALGSTFISLAWDPSPADDEGDLPACYRIYRDGAFVGSSFTRRFTDLGLEPDQGYDYEIRAVDYAGNEGSPYSTRRWTRALED